jgi:protein-tyrosine phosphatase
VQHRIPQNSHKHLIGMRTHADIYWIENPARGRLAIVGRPRAGDWLEDEISGWRAMGLSDVVSLLENDEMRELGLEQEAIASMNAGLSFERFPIPDRGVPFSANAAVQLLDSIASRITIGRSVGIHCRAGIGRSGFIAAGVLLRLGVPESDAWQRVSTARGLRVPDTDEQRAWVSSFIARRQIA